MKLTMCVGLPASGKTTWAKQQCEENPNIVRVNKDDIRAELTKTGWTWSHEREKDVVKIRDERIILALSNYMDVISDDTNFHRSHRERLKQLAAQYSAEFVEKFFSVDIEEAIRRDSLRPNSVGESVIRGMAKQYLPPPIVPYVEDPNLPWAIMCDLDGTAAIITNRSPYDGGSCHLDTSNKSVRRVLQTMCGPVPQYQIIYMSGRDDCHEAITRDWLLSNNFPNGPIYMRKTGDKRQDYIVKGELFDANVRGKYNILFVLDDRNQVVNYWRSIGLTCWQVAPGDF